MNTMWFPIGTNLYKDAPFEVRRRLQTTFDRFGIKTAWEVVGESLLRLDICGSDFRPCQDDNRATTLFKMFDFYKSLP